jgi:hypothetical protein
MWGVRWVLRCGFGDARCDSGFWDFGDGGEVSVDWAEGEVFDYGLGIDGGFLVFG